MRTSRKFLRALCSTIRNDDLTIATTWQNQRCRESFPIFHLAERLRDRESGPQKSQSRTQRAQILFEAPTPPFYLFCAFCVLLCVFVVYQVSSSTHSTSAPRLLARPP